MWDQACETDHSPLPLCNPDVLGTDLREVLVESPAWVFTANLGAVEYIPMPLGQLDPEFAARVEIAWLVASYRRHRGESRLGR